MKVFICKSFHIASERTEGNFCNCFAQVCKLSYFTEHCAKVTLAIHNIFLSLLSWVFYSDHTLDDVAKTLE